MTSASHPHDPPPRWSLKPESGTGHVDGAWWPGSRDLAAELPDLVTALTPRLGRVETVTYHLADWSGVPRRLGAVVGGIRLGGYRTQHADTVEVSGPQRRFTLVVIDPDTAADRAERILATAAGADDVGTVTDLLGDGVPARTPEPVA